MWFSELTQKMGGCCTGSKVDIYILVSLVSPISSSLASWQDADFKSGDLLTNMSLL
jgi:hypothetical protein